MDSEFPALEEIKGQKEFLRDWWSPRKLLIGGRASGKSEMMLSELRRFERNGFSCLFLANTEQRLRHHNKVYSERFGEQMTCHTGSLHQLRRSNLRGLHVDVVIMDDIHNIAFEHISKEVLPMMPSFIRASANKGDLHDHHYLGDEPGFFHSVYEI